MRLLERLAARRKNRAIREGRWHSRQFETYESALSNAKALVDAILGKEIDKKYRDGWDDDIVGDGSQNHPLLGAACEFWYQRTRNLPKMTAVLDAWLRYSRLHYMTGETYSSFIYGLWIHGAILTVAFGARLVGRHDVADALYGIMRTGYSLWALGCSGDDWGGSHPGKAVAWAGSRSWITKKDDDGNYYDRDGVLLEPYNVDTTFATNFLAAALGWAAPKKWLGDLVAAMATVDPAEPWGLSETDKGTLRLVALAQEPLEQLDAFDRVVGWLEAADPLPAIPCRVVKTRQWVGFFALFSIHPFSTSFLYARIWFKDGRPVGIWWDNLWPGIDRRAGWFNVDPSVRKAGVHGYLEVADVGATSRPTASTTSSPAATATRAPTCRGRASSACPTRRGSTTSASGRTAPRSTGRSRGTGTARRTVRRSRTGSSGSGATSGSGSGSRSLLQAVRAAVPLGRLVDPLVGAAVEPLVLDAAVGELAHDPDDAAVLLVRDLALVERAGVLPRRQAVQFRAAALLPPDADEAGGLGLELELQEPLGVEADLRHAPTLPVVESRDAVVGAVALDLADAVHDELAAGLLAEVQRDLPQLHHLAQRHRHRVGVDELRLDESGVGDEAGDDHDQHRQRLGRRTPQRELHLAEVDLAVAHRNTSSRSATDA
jgi:hypothetical protein